MKLQRVFTAAFNNLLPACYQKYHACRLAQTSKRLDLCAAQWAHILHLVKDDSVRDKVCLEIGSGWVLSHALILYLLGARRIIATDIHPYAQPQSLDYAVGKAVPSIIRDILSPFNEHQDIRRRLDILKDRNFSFDCLKSLGIEYLAPIDLAKEKLRQPVDLIYSFSVLEHVPTTVIGALLLNLESMLSENGVMLHCIHMEDHNNIQENPFEFLQKSLQDYGEDLQPVRGNRIRASGWKKLFAALVGSESGVIYEWQRLDKPLPPLIDKSIEFIDEHDLRTSHLGIYVQKLPRRASSGVVRQGEVLLK